ncbi:MAG: Rid family detoxifying hydrolase [Mariprofundales bacterium]|nr:Rid family detoxifying hydrolase [Mariprofundales bacterium]
MDIVNSKQAPKAVGPYSHAVVHDGIVYASGQIGLDPITGKLVAGGIAAEAKQVMQNLTAVLNAAGSAPGQIIKTGIYLIDMTDFSVVNALYAEWLGDHRPARATVAVAQLPLGAKVEMDVIAAKG